MEQTAAKPAPAAVPTTPETGVTAKPPTPPTPQPAGKQKPLLVRGLELLADLRITVFLFALAMIIVFWGTLSQVDNGVWTIVNKYFRSAFVWVPLRVVLFNMIDDNGVAMPFPGGWLIGGAMLVNLIAAHVMRFKLTWARGGILMIHAGLIVMMLSEVITGVYAIEGQILVQEGQTVNSVTHPGSAEFALIRRIDDKTDDVITVPRRLLKPGAVIDDPRLPFVMEITDFFVNSDVKGFPKGNPDPDARGHARVYFAVELPEVSGVATNQRHDAPSMNVNLKSRDGKKLGKWLFTPLLENTQSITLDDKKPDETTYNINLRFKQTQRDFRIHLDKFTYDKFDGVNIPKDFHSYIRLTDESAGIVDRKAEIYMNAPMTYKGETFYQQSWTTDPMTGEANGTILQVVRNPGWAMPYIACFVVGGGMLWHFGITLHRFVDRRIIR